MRYDWTEADIDIRADIPDKEVAAKYGLSVNGVRTHRLYALKIPSKNPWGSAVKHDYALANEMKFRGKKYREISQATGIPISTLFFHFSGRAKLSNRNHEKAHGRTEPNVKYGANRLKESLERKRRNLRLDEDFFYHRWLPSLGGQQFMEGMRQ